MNFYVFELLLLVVMTGTETIHFTNSPSHLVRSKNFTSYQLQVPGSNTITIIEASNEDQSLNSKIEDLNKQLSQFPEEPFPAKTSQSADVHQNFSADSKKTVFAPTLLDKFLLEYKSKVKTAMSVDSNIQDGSIDYNNDRQNRYKDYDRYQPKVQPANPGNPFNEKEGWVSLQAVPWSKSHVSKWKPKGEVKPLESVSSFSVYRSPSQHPVPSRYTASEGVTKPSYLPHRSPSYNYDDRERFNVNGGSQANSYKGVPWNTSKYSKWSNTNQDIETSDSGDRWYNYGQSNYDELKKPNDDEVFMNDYNENLVRIPGRKSVYNANTNSQQFHETPYSIRPSSHPTNGNGEWVLISTTKGYQTNRLHRSMNFSEFKPPSSIRTHKAIKLTVLPAKPTGVNQTGMTTSHGGILEVDSSLQPVEASVSADANKKKNKPKIKRTLKAQLVQAVPMHNNDESAVIAAVGTGMVPATVAMLMPMVLGRKKRDTIRHQRKKYL